MKSEPINTLSDTELFLLKINACYEPELSVKGTQKAIEIIQNQMKQITQLTNNWNELEEWVKQNSWYYNTSDGCQWVDQFKLLDKMKEIKEKNNDKR